MKKEINRRNFITFAFATGFGMVSLFDSHFSFADSENSDFRDVRRKIKHLVETGSPTSLAITVSKTGKIIWEEAFGWANRERRIPATIRTRYAIASVSKTFTATGLMILVERGLVKLNDPISNYLGNTRLIAYAGDSSSVTVKHLLQHTSGLPRNWRNFHTDEREFSPTLQETIQRYGFLTSVPGEQYNYSNLNYALLSLIIERVSGIPFAVFMQKEVRRRGNHSVCRIYLTALDDRSARRHTSDRYCVDSKRDGQRRFGYRLV